MNEDYIFILYRYRMDLEAVEDAHPEIAAFAPDYDKAKKAMLRLSEVPAEQIEEMRLEEMELGTLCDVLEILTDGDKFSFSPHPIMPMPDLFDA